MKYNFCFGIHSQMMKMNKIFYLKILSSYFLIKRWLSSSLKVKVKIEERGREGKRVGETVGGDTHISYTSSVAMESSLLSI